MNFELPHPFEGKSIRVLDDVRSDLVGPLMETILAERAAKPHSAASLNDGGWKSGEIFAGPPAVRRARGLPACFDELALAIRDSIPLRDLAQADQISGWAMINAGGSSHPRHRHYGAIVTGVYYLTAGDPVNPVPTTFETPRATWGAELQVDPVAARLVIFPGDLWHSVPRVDTNVPRISIAFDMRR